MYTNILPPVRATGPNTSTPSLPTTIPRAAKPEYPQEKAKENCQYDERHQQYKQQQSEDGSENISGGTHK
jgi:hypothetical protein